MATAQVHVGRWTDWSYGPVFGDRVTLPSNGAGALVAFIAIFDAFIGGLLWGLVAFFMHRCRATTQPKDGMHHQLQILLRNSPEPLSFISQALQVGWRWRGRVPRAIPRAFAIAILPILIATVFAVAGVFSSRIASAGDVLLVGGNCGLELLNKTTEIPKLELQFDIGLATEDGINYALSNAYAQNCYRNPLDPTAANLADEYSPGSNCATFVKQSLNYTASFGASCPFQDACSVPDSQIITLDTGWMDSHDHLGMNQPPQNRVLFRKKTTCSPLKTKGFSTNEFHHVKDFEIIGDIATYNYGINYGQPVRFGYPSGLPGPNTTFVYGYKEQVSAIEPYYILTASTMDYGTYGYQFRPLPSVSADDYAPISMFFLGNRAFYLEEVDDPWFEAKKSVDVPVTSYGLAENQTLYVQELPGTVLACLEEAEWCNPNVAHHNACTDAHHWYDLGGFTGYYSSPEKYTVFTDPFPKGMGLNKYQMATMMAIQTSFLYSQTFSIVQQLGRQALLANNLLLASATSISFPLPSNQWHIEVANWFSVGLSIIQHTFVSGWRKPVVNEFAYFWQPFKANDTVENSLCSSQKVKGSQYQSFSVFALIVNFVIGAVIAIACLAVEHIHPRRERNGRQSVAREQWVAYGILQTQRLLYESEGVGDWEGVEDFVPVTKAGQVFRMPGDSDKGRGTEPLGPSSKRSRDWKTQATDTSYPPQQTTNYNETFDYFQDIDIGLGNLANGDHYTTSSIPLVQRSDPTRQQPRTYGESTPSWPLMHSEQDEGQTESPGSFLARPHPLRSRISSDHQTQQRDFV